jgi:YteA family regulatory protein
MKKNLADYKEKLLTKRKKVLKKLNLIDDRESSYEGLNHNLKESTGELSSYDNHPGDNASSTFERGKDIGIKDNAKLFLTMINDALQRIEQGNYGVCDKCGVEIDEDRLEVIPYSTICYDCKSEIDSVNREDRPLEEESFLELDNNEYLNQDNFDSIIYDGEDAWHDVAKVGNSNPPSDTIE